jgi:hypothetical protein
MNMRLFLLAVCACTLSCANIEMAVAKAKGDSRAKQGPPTKEVSESGPGPQAASEYFGNAVQCAPSCYEPEPEVAPLDPVRGCGYKLYTIREAKTGPSSWGKVQDAAEYGEYWAPYPCDAFPKPQAQWKKELAEARTLIGKLKSDDMVVVDPDWKDWSYETNALEQVVGRGLRLRVYRHDVETRPNPCAGGKEALVFCEKGRSNFATALNAAEATLQQAEAAKTAGKKNGCRQTAWTTAAYVESGRTIRSLGKDQHSWVPGAKYELRDGKVLTEDEVLKRFDALGAKATALFKECGGSGNPPINDNQKYLAEEALKKQKRLFPDGVVRAIPR